MKSQELFDFLMNNPYRAKLPEDPVIRGDLILNGKSITWLPDNLIVTGNLSVATCWNLRELPANLFVGGDLRMSLTRLWTIPRDLNVRGNIDAGNLNLEIPEGFTANGDLYLNGYTDQYLKRKPALCLPDNLTVNGTLNITNREIINWPKNLTVKGRLVIDGTEFHRIGQVTISGLDC